MKKTLLCGGMLLLVLSAAAIRAQDDGWTIPAEESKYWLMRRPQELRQIAQPPHVLELSVILDDGEMEFSHRR